MLLALGAYGAFGQQGHIIGSKHDLASPGVAACEQCHIPHDAYGDYLWARGPNPAGGTYVGIRPLCYSCHDGTVTEEGRYAFDETLSQHPTVPGEPSKDCDMCHNAHTPEYGNFLLFPSGANLCRSCHGKAGPTDHPVDVDAAVAPLDSQWNPITGDLSGTRLWDAAGAGPGSQVKCLSCHSAHGGLQGSDLSTMLYRDPTSTISPLCQNCHP